MTAIRIEIGTSFGKDKWKIRVGDIDGCFEDINVSKEEVIDTIKARMLMEEQEKEL